MKAFHCDHCSSLVFFDNVACVRCGHALGFLPDVRDLSALELDETRRWRALVPTAKERRYNSCRNGIVHQVCNWYVPEDDPNPYCVACRLNEVIPDLSVPGNLGRWHKLEKAKRRIVYTLMRLALPLDGGPTPTPQPLRFRFLADPLGGPPVLTGHRCGAITVNIVEADDDERERRRLHLREPYRTLLGHLRHEIAHYYWDLLVGEGPRLAGFRELFGDERIDYDSSLRRYYDNGPAADWQTRTVSAYASAHPWEDWAETWAHYLHVVDTVETAASFGIILKPDHPDARAMTANPVKVADPDTGFDEVLAHWLPLTSALNSLNRGMGLPDHYPFVLCQPAVDKLRFVHDVVREERQRALRQLSTSNR